MLLWVHDGDDFRLADINDAAEDFLRLPRDQIVGSSSEKLGGDHVRSRREMQRAVTSGSSVAREVPYFLPGGDLRHVEVTYVGISNDALLAFVHDITSERAAEERLRLTEGRYQAVVTAANEGVWTGDRAGRTTFANEIAARMLGGDRDDLMGRPFQDFVGDEAAAAISDRLRENGGPIHAELQLQRLDGRRLDVVANVCALRGDRDEIVGTLAMLTDVSRLKREQTELRESEERFAQVFEEAPLGMAFIGAGRFVRGRFLGVNRAFEDLVGYSESELLEKDILSITHPDDVDMERVLVSAVFAQEREDYELDKRFVRPDGTAVWSRFRMHVLRDDNGAPLYGVAVAVDISTEREARARASSFDKRVRAVLDSTRDALFELGADGSIAELNNAALRMFACEREDLAGKSLALALVPERLRVRVIQAIGEWLRAAAEERPIEPTETTMMRIDGSEFPAALRIAPINVGGERRLMLWVRNLGLQDAIQNARREAEERFERLFRDGAVATVAIDTRGLLADVNPAFCKLSAREAQALIGRRADEILGDAGDACDPPWQSGTERPGPLTGARRIVRADGCFVPVQVTASLVRDASATPVQWLCQCVPLSLADAPALPAGEPLSYRERQVLGLLARGHDGPAIAERLGLAAETVRSYANSAREKTGAKTRTEAVALALVRGEISL